MSISEHGRVRMSKEARGAYSMISRRAEAVGFNVAAVADGFGTAYRIYRRDATGCNDGKHVAEVVNVRDLARVIQGIEIAKS